MPDQKKKGIKNIPSDNKSSNNTPSSKTHPIVESIDYLIIYIDGFRASTPRIEQLYDDTVKKYLTKLKKEIDKYGKVSQKKDGKKSFSFFIQNAGNALNIIDELQKISISRETLPTMFLLTLVSQYDAFLAGLLKAIFKKKPDLMSTSDKQLRFSEISGFKSIEAIKDSIMEHEIEGILRESHTKQFEIMEKKFDVTLTSGLDCWPEFIEITERRNLFAHTNGIVSRQYISICKKNGVMEENLPDIGEKLNFDPQYFIHASNVFYEISVKLAHVLWRKIFPKELALSDNHYNGICYNLIKAGHYDIAIKLLDFICDVQKKHSNDNNLLYMKFNRCNAHRLAGRQARCIELLDVIDTTALGIEFRLVEAILRNDFELAGKLMKKIGSKHEVIRQASYSEWPIFEGFRESKHFLEAYEKIYKAPFTVTPSFNPENMDW